MEVDVAEADIMAESEFVLGLPRIAGAIAACRPEHMNFVDQIEQLVRACPRQGRPPYPA